MINNKNGNALFLILIAVALFAALSYAVTNSGRGGSGIDKEKASILAAQLSQNISAIQSAILRLKMVSGYDQVFLNDSAANANGTCFVGSTGRSPCSTVGMFGSDGVLSGFQWSEEMRDPAFTGDTARYIGLTSLSISINGVDIGTPAPEVILEIGGIDEDICKNLDEQNGGTVGTLTIKTGNGYNYAALGMWTSTGYTTAQGFATDIMYDLSKKGCVHYAPTKGNFFVYILEEN